MNRFASLSAVLDELSPELPAAGPGWDDVLGRTGPVVGSKRRARRRLALAACALVVVIVPLVALAAVNDWWFFQFRDVPAPLSKPLVVTSGSWEGHPWRLVAYNSAAGTCWSITFSEATSGGAAAYTLGPGATGNAANALSCGGIVGLRPPGKVTVDLPTVSYMLGYSEERNFPTWIAGPVVSAAQEVVVRFHDGTVVRTPTTKEVDLGKVGWYGPLRFFAAPLPSQFLIPITTAPYKLDMPVSLTGLDDHGKVVACFMPSLTGHGYSLLSECKP
jgi:hypothetical protein